MRISKAEETGALCLEGALDIYEAEALRLALLEHLAASPELALDLHSVEACDTAAAQLLFSSRLTAGLAGKSFLCLNVPPVVREVWLQLGLPLDLPGFSLP
jgi:anti-anti-sigma regulatory factor